MEDPESVILSFDIGVKNLALAAINGRHELRAWKIIALAAEKEKIPSINELSGRLFMALDELLTNELNGCVIETVLLENQPSRLNGSMKSIQMMIYSYFQLRRHWEGLVRNVHMVSASQKLLNHEHEPGTPEKPKTGYELNKWKAIQLAKVYIKGDSKLEAIFAAHKKKDDLSDALLQVISWLRKHGKDISAVTSYKDEVKVAEVAEVAEEDHNAVKST